MIESIQITRIIVCDNSNKINIAKVFPQMVQPRRVKKKRKERGKEGGGARRYSFLACERNSPVDARDGGARSQDRKVVVSNIDFGHVMKLNQHFHC